MEVKSEWRLCEQSENLTPHEPFSPLRNFRVRYPFSCEGTFIMGFVEPPPSSLSAFRSQEERYKIIIKSVHVKACIYCL